MKKFAIFSVFLFALGGTLSGAFAGICTETRKTGFFDYTFSSGSDNEYLYGSNNKYSSAEVIECKSSCDGSYALMPIGHVFKGQVQNNVILYRCFGKSGSGNVWQVQTISQLQNCDVNICSNVIDPSVLVDGYYIFDKQTGSTGYAAYNSGGQLLTQSITDLCKCSEGTVKEEACKKAGNIWENGQCVSKDEAECKKRPHMEWKGGQCICRVTGWVESSDKTKCLDPELKRAEEASARQAAANAAAQRQAAEAAARLKAAKDACDAVGTSVATWDGSKCTCVNPLMTWDGKKCVDGVELQNLKNKCASTTGARWVDGFGCQCTDADKYIPDGGTMCVERPELAEQREAAAAAAERTRQQNITISTNTIKTLSGNIQKLADGLKVTVWKTSEGKFNTSRLVSDSVAGVVLGTAGGLITSNVIKKNQVDNGFDDISCTVGGQVVAGWGDEFRVGINY